MTVSVTSFSILKFHCNKYNVTCLKFTALAFQCKERIYRIFIQYRFRFNAYTNLLMTWHKKPVQHEAQKIKVMSVLLME
jgi:hypothetical protein